MLPLRLSGEGKGGGEPRQKGSLFPVGHKHRSVAGIFGKESGKERVENDKELAQNVYSGGEQQLPHNRHNSHDS